MTITPKTPWKDRLRDTFKKLEAVRLIKEDGDTILVLSKSGTIREITTVKEYTK